MYQVQSDPITGWLLDSPSQHLSRLIERQNVLLGSSGGSKVSIQNDENIKNFRVHVEFMVGNLLYQITEYLISETVVMAMCIAPHNCTQY